MWKKAALLSKPPACSSCLDAAGHCTILRSMRAAGVLTVEGCTAGWLAGDALRRQLYRARQAGMLLAQEERPPSHCEMCCCCMSAAATATVVLQTAVPLLCANSGCSCPTSTQALTASLAATAAQILVMIRTASRRQQKDEPDLRCHSLARPHGPVDQSAAESCQQQILYHKAPGNNFRHTSWSHVLQACLQRTVPAGCALTVGSHPHVSWPSPGCHAC